MFDVFVLFCEVEGWVIYLEGEGRVLVEYITEWNRSGGFGFYYIGFLWFGWYIGFE